MAYATPDNTTIGLDGFMNYLSNAIGAQFGIGYSTVGLIVLVPLWFITFFVLSTKFGNGIGAFTTASFVCMVVSLLLLTNNYISPVAIMIFAGLTVIGLVQARISNGR